MDVAIQKALNDRLYDRRKGGALELENLVRECLSHGDHDRIQKIVHQLCYEYAYAIHQPHARNGGLIGLAAAAIALGPEVARYLEEIVPPVLACFSDQDARVRYYACESMYNIAKVAKGEILVYFNEVFDALCKLAADSELSVKNGAELLDRLVKDIVAESAASYVSVLQTSEKTAAAGSSDPQEEHIYNMLPAFSLSRFMPLLKDRIAILNPYTRMFLVSWITVLDSIPDLELVAHLPTFLAGLFRFLSDGNQDVYAATHTCLEKFLAEIKKIARIKDRLEQDRGARIGRGHRSDRSHGSAVDTSSEDAIEQHPSDIDDTDHSDISDASGDDEALSQASGDDWIPGQDVQVDHAKILDILISFLGGTSEEEIQLTALRWIDSFFGICPNDMLDFVPRLLSHVLPAMANDVDRVRQAASRVNTALMNYILSLPEDDNKADNHMSTGPPHVGAADANASAAASRTDLGHGSRSLKAVSREQSMVPPENLAQADAAGPSSPQPAPPPPQTEQRQSWNLDYEAAVNSLTLQFLNDHEETRVAALNWLIMLQQKAPAGRKLEINDGTFPALLKTLSDSSDAVVTRDLVLLSQMFRNSDDAKFQSFMVNLLKLFCTDRRLLETRGNLVIRQLCVSLSGERIYRTLADCLEKDEDVDFASIMVQNLNNNLITAPELADLRKRLRNLDTRDGQMFFVTLFKSWCNNAVATFSLCLLAQAYEQAYYLLQIFAELEMSVNMLIQIDKLVQLLESPVFTYLRLQLLEPDRFPHLYKCLYGLLMLLPQSSAFAALKNRLGSVSAIGYLHVAGVTSSLAPNTNVTGVRSGLGTQTPSIAAAATPGFDRPNRLKAREDGAIRWTELLEKFRTTQERARRRQRGLNADEDPSSAGGNGVIQSTSDRESHLAPGADGQRRAGTPTMRGVAGLRGAQLTTSGLQAQQQQQNLQQQQQQQQPAVTVGKVKTGLGNFSRFTSGRKAKK